MNVNWVSLASAYVRQNPRVAVNIAFEVGLLVGLAVAKRRINVASAIVTLAPALYDIQRPDSAPAKRRAVRSVARRRA